MPCISSYTSEQTLEAARILKKLGNPTNGEDASGEIRPKVRTRQGKRGQR